MFKHADHSTWSIIPLFHVQRFFTINDVNLHILHIENSDRNMISICKKCRGENVLCLNKKNANVKCYNYCKCNIVSYQSCNCTSAGYFCQCSRNTVLILWVFAKWLLLWFMNAWFVSRALGVSNSLDRSYSVSLHCCHERASKYN